MDEPVVQGLGEQVEVGIAQTGRAVARCWLSHIALACHRVNECSLVLRRLAERVSSIGATDSPPGPGR